MNQLKTKILGIALLSTFISSANDNTDIPSAQSAPNIIPVEVNIHNNGYADLLLLRDSLYTSEHLLVQLVPQSKTETYLLHAVASERGSGYLAQAYQLQWSSTPRTYEDLNFQIWTEDGAITDAQCSTSDSTECSADFEEKKVRFNIKAQNSIFD